MPMSIRRVIAPAAVFVCNVVEHEMAGERGMNADMSRLGVAHLADHDDVGIVPQERAQRQCEGQSPMPGWTWV